MTLTDETTLSYYQELTILAEGKQVYLVQHQTNKKIYVKKIRHIHDKSLYHHLQSTPIPGIPRILECIQDGTNLILIEEFIQGDTLETLADTSTHSFSEEEVQNYAIQLCEILEKLHAMQPPIIHRDIKPGNLILSADGRIKLIDFDAARLFHEDAIQDTLLLGTQHFAAPEQYGFGQSDARSDLYGLAATMNYLLTGYTPNEGIADGKLGEILGKCLSMNMDDRYHNATELKTQLLALDKSISPQKIDFTPPGFRTRHIWKIILAVIGYVLIFTVSLTSEIRDSSNQLASPLETYLSRFMLLAMGLTTVLWFSNYLNAQEYFPFMRKKKPWHPLLILIYWLLIMLGIIILFMIPMPT